MQTKNSTEEQYHEICQLINEVVKNDFISDKVYEKITAKIGQFDESVLHTTTDSTRLTSLKEKTDRIFTILKNACPHLDTATCQTKTEHIGDYFSDDKSFPLSAETKNAFLAILKEAN